MSISKNPRTGIYEADVRDRTIPRLHISLRTKRKAEAMTRHEALVKLVREGHADLVDRLRRQKLGIEAVEACARQGKPFETLREGAEWPTVESAVAAYLTALDANPNRAFRTWRTSRSQLDKLLAFEYEGEKLGDLRVDSLPTAAIEAYTLWMKENYAPGTVTDHIMRVSGLYTWLRKREAREAREAGRGARLLHSPVDPETQPREKPTRERFLTTKEIGVLLAATPLAWRFPVMAGLAGGLRVGEVQHLRPGTDVNLDRGLIYIQARKGWKPKRGRERTVPMTPALREAAAWHRDHYASETYMVLGARGARISDGQMWTTFTRIAADAGLGPADVTARRDDPERVTFHTLRHTFASHLVMRSVDIFTVAQLLGDTVQTVEKVYAHLAPDHKREAVQRLGAIIEAVEAAAGNEAALDGAGVEEVTTSDTTDSQNGTNPHV